MTLYGCNSRSIALNGLICIVKSKFLISNAAMGCTCIVDKAQSAARFSLCMHQFTVFTFMLSNGLDRKKKKGKNSIDKV